MQAAILSVHASRHFQVGASDVLLGGKANLKFGAGENVSLDVFGEVEMITGHNRDAHAELLDSHTVEDYVVLDGRDEIIIERVGVIVKFQAGLDVEIGYDREVVDAAELDAAAIVVAVDDYIIGLLYACPSPRVGDE